MSSSIQSFVLEKQIIKGGHGFLVGKIGQDNAIIKLTLPVVSIDSLSFYTGLDHYPSLRNDVYRTASTTLTCELGAEIRCPVTLNEIAQLSEHYHTVRESYEEYCNSQPVPSWITKFLDEEPDQNRDSIVHSDERIVVVQHADVSSLRWSCIFRDPSLQSIRDIPSVDMVEDIKKDILMLLKDHGILEHKTCLYFDYCGKDTRLCLTIAGISRSLENLHCNGKFIYLDTLVQNLRINKDYYKGEIFMVKNK